MILQLHMKQRAPLCQWCLALVLSLAAMFCFTTTQATAGPKATPRADAFGGVVGSDGSKRQRLGQLRGPKRRFKRRKKSLIRLPPGPAQPTLGKGTHKPKQIQPAMGKGSVGLGKGASADDVAAKQAALIRRQRIKMMLALLRQLKGDTPSNRAQQVRLYHRLTESYLDESKYLSFVAMKRHTKHLDAWTQACQKRRERKLKCTKRPKPALARALAYRSQSARVAQRLLHKYPRYQRADEVHFSLLLTLQMLRRRKAASRSFRVFLRRYKKSRFLADAYMVMADQAFQHNVVNDAWRYYKAAMTTAAKRLRGANSPALAVRMRGVHLRSMYMLAWCNLNIGDLTKSLRGFQAVQRLSRRYKRTRESKILFVTESLRDMLQVYAKMGKTRAAYIYLRQVLGPKRAHKATRQLAGRLSRMGHDLAALKAYALLQQRAPSGKIDPGHALVPSLQLEMIQSAHKIESPARVYARISRLMKMLQGQSSWSRRWRRTSIWRAVREAAEQSMVTWSVSYHKQAQSKEKKKPKLAEQYYTYAIKLYQSYLLAFAGSESSNELRFFLAELLYRKARKRQGSKRKLRPAVKRIFARAARHYRIVATAGDKASRRGNPYRKPATFAEMLCYEKLVGKSRRFRPRRINQKDLRKDARGRVTWKRDKIEPNSPQSRLLSVYRRYLKIAKGDEERLQTYFKLGVLYAAHRYYLRSTDIFSEMTREFPQHELSRRAAFMILYSYQDLQQWKKLERSARQFLKDSKLTENRVFRKEMYRMLLRSTYTPYLAKVIAMRKQKKRASPSMASRFVRYANEFGLQGPWARRGFKPSSRAPYALGVAADCYVKNRSIFHAIRVRRQLLRLYPKHRLAEASMLALGAHFEQIASYGQAAGWLERYANLPESTKRPKPRRARRKRGQRSAPLAAQKHTAALVKRRKLQANALYRAAVFRRGLGQFVAAVRLYRLFLTRFPKRPESAELPLAIAQTFEQAKQWPQALVAYKAFLARAQAPALTKYLVKAVKLIRAQMPKQGLISQVAMLHHPNAKQRAAKRPLLLRRLGRLPRKLLVQPHLLYVHAQMASLYKRLGKPAKRSERMMLIEALGFQMYLHKVPTIALGQRGRDAFAEARFFLVDQARKSYRSMRFVGHQVRDRKTLRTLIKSGRRLARDYAEVARLRSPEWALAAVFRTGQIYHQFAEKLLSAPTPNTLTAVDSRRYQLYIQQMAMRFEEPALDAYDAVLRKSAQLGLYNPWVRLCEKARDRLSRRKGRINPYTIFRRRPAAFWMVELHLAAPALRRWGSVATRPPTAARPSVRSRVPGPGPRSYVVRPAPRRR